MKFVEMYEKINGLVALEIFDYGDTQSDIENEFSKEWVYLTNMSNDLFSEETEDGMFNILRIYDVYFRNGKPIISDNEYEGLYKIYAVAHGEDTVAPIIFEPSVAAWKKVDHVIPMGSLDKQSSIEEIEKWNGKKNIDGHERLMSEKMDGISCEVTYEKGRFVKAATRGDGKVGDDITENAIYFDGVIKRLNEPWDCAIRGELMITKENLPIINKILIKKGKDPLKNTRNGVSGQATRYKHRDEEILSLITFVAYDVQVFDMHETGENVV